MVAGVEGAELGGHVAAAAPFQGGEVGGVGHGEVVEGGEQALVESGPETQLGGNTAVEPVEDVEPVGALGGGGEAEQELRAEVIEPAGVAGGGGVVELVHDHHLEAIGGDLGQAALGEGLHRGEHMAPLAGDLAIHVELAEGGIAQHLAEGGERLLQDLLAVGDQQQGRGIGRGEALGKVGVQTGHVEGGEHGFAGAGGGHHQVVPAVVQRALGRQLIKHLALVGVGPQIEPHRQSAAASGGIVTAGEGELVIEAGLLDGGGVIGLEFALFPVGVEGGLELAEHRRGFQGGQAHVPLQSVEQGGGREVGGADVSGAGAAGTVKEPRLGMQTCTARVGADPHLGATLHQPVERLAIGGAHVDGGEHVQGAAGVEVGAQLVLQQTEPAPLDEGAEQVNPIG